MCGRTARPLEKLVGKSARGVIYLLWAVGRPLAQLAASTVDYLGEIAVRVRGSFGGG